MSALVVWIAVATWALGMVAVIAPDLKMPRSEWLMLAAWPVTVPLFAGLRVWRRWAYTCPDCGGWYGDREHYRLHLRKRTNCTVAPESPCEVCGSGDVVRAGRWDRCSNGHSYVGKRADR